MPIREATREEIPIVDMSPLVADPVAGVAPVAEQIGRACRGLGFFYLTGHGVTPEERAGLFDQARRFFALPQAAKDAIGIERSPHNRGYVRMEGESLDPALPPDLKEGFNIGLELAPDDPELAAGVPFRGLNAWPEGLQGWRTAMLDYFDRAKAICDRLHRAIAVDLGLEPDYFAPAFRRPLATLRLLHYPPTPPASPGQIGAGAHTDYGNLTLLLTDGVGGLQVKARDGDWLAAPHIEGAFVCNIGDCLMRWSNDVYVSTPHRVIPTGERDRYSIPFFYDPDPDADIRCLPTCVTDARPPRYSPTTGAAYLKSRLDATYAFRSVVSKRPWKAEE